MVRKEKASLARTKQLLTKFRGDENWVPCGALQGEDDVAFFRLAPLGITYGAPEIHGTEANRLSLTNGGPQKRQEPQSSYNDIRHSGGESLAGDPAVEEGRAPESTVGGGQKVHPTSARVALVNGPKDAADPNGKHDEIKSDTSRMDHVPIGDFSGAMSDNVVEGIMKTAESSSVDQPTKQNGPVEPNEGIVTELDQASDQATAASMGMCDHDPITVLSDEGKEQAQVDDPIPAPHRMTTRAQAQAASDNTASAETVTSSRASSASPIIHPIFKVPESAHPDRDLGLPYSEAEETRRLLLLYVQKQEEICRGAEKLSNGLLQADRMRRMVMKWAKAEAHVGEMSDGEDWYDKDEWGLDEDLRKGHEEEEDDGNNHGKKTRGRRA